MFHTLDTFDTEFSADSVEWCPADSFKDLFVCGTYQLTETEDSTLKQSQLSKRLGRIYMLRATSHGKIALLQQLEVPAVLDMKWAHATYQDRILLGVVNSIGYLQIYQLKNECKEALELLTEHKVIDSEEEVLALSLDWCTGKWAKSKSNPMIVVSNSKGSISLFELQEKELKQILSWHAHEFEAWIAAFDYWNTNVIYTGGDDSKFLRFDTRIGTNPMAINKTHNAGVTSIHSNAEKEFLLSSGSYDEILRLWDTRNFKRPISESNLGGGIWRLKWDPFEHEYLLAACMYGGFRLIKCGNVEVPSVIGEYNEHESISYGCDWSFLNRQEISERAFKSEAGNDAVIGTCSFYDHTLKLSAVLRKSEACRACVKQENSTGYLMCVI